MTEFTIYELDQKFDELVFSIIELSQISDALIEIFPLDYMDEGENMSLDLSKLTETVRYAGELFASEEYLYEVANVLNKGNAYLEDFMDVFEDVMLSSETVGNMISEMVVAYDDVEDRLNELVMVLRWEEQED